MMNPMAQMVLPMLMQVSRDCQLLLGGTCTGRLPETVQPGRVFSVLVSVVRSGGTPLKPFGVPPGGRLLALIIDAPGLRVLCDHRQTVLVPPDGDSEPVKFDLIGDEPGPRRISVTAWDGGSYLGELAVEISVERDGPARPDRTAISEAREERTDGEVTLLVRYDPHQMAYRFEFVDVDYPDEVTSELVSIRGPLLSGSSGVWTGWPRPRQATRLPPLTLTWSMRE